MNKNKIIFYSQGDPEEQFLQNFQSVYTFDGSVFVDRAEEIITDYYEDLKMQLAHLIRSRMKLHFDIFEPRKTISKEVQESAELSEPSKLSDSSNLSELSELSDSSESTSVSSNNCMSNLTTCDENDSNCCVERPVIATLNEEPNTKTKDKEVTKFVQELVNTLEMLAKEKIKAKAEKRLKIISKNQT